MIDIEYDEEVERPARAELMLEAKLGYRNKGDPKGEWKEYARSFESRNLDCNIDPDLSIEERADPFVETQNTAEVVEKVVEKVVEEVKG